MKLRIRGNTLRLRLKRGEVEQIAAGQSIVEETRFPDGALNYRLDVSNGVAIHANLDASGLVVCLPESSVSGWASTDDVSLMAEQDLPEGDTLSILIEKDFACLEPGHGRDCEDDADTFPHPRAESHDA